MVESAVLKWVDSIPQHLKMGISEMTIDRQKLYLGWSLQKQNPSLVGIIPLQSFGNKKGKCGLRQRKGKEKIWLGPKRKPPHNKTQPLTSAPLISSTSRLDCRTQLLWDPDLTCQTPPPLKETSGFHSNCSHIFWKFTSVFPSQQAHLKITTLVLFGTARHVTLITLLEQN